jgi:phosphoserine phosphatase
MANPSLEQIKNEILLSLDYFESKPNILFDLDGTLVEHDTSEAVYGYLISQGQKIDYSWREYQTQIASGEIAKAYKNMIKCLEGISPPDIEEATNQVMESDEEYVNIFQDGEAISIPLPKIYSSISILVEFFISMELVPIVISASCDISVKTVAERYFNIPSKKAHGVSSELLIDNNESKLSGELLDPCPVLEGKAELYRHIYGKSPVAFAAGDSLNDRFLLDLVDKKGKVLLVGQDSLNLEKIAKSILHSKSILFNPK